VKHDSRIDALYQLPLGQFTEKRNALAKELSGTSRKQVKFLAKPPLPIWAVNQLYWNDRPTYNALIDASEKLRAAHRSALSGQKTDVRKPEQVHRAALEQAVSKALGFLETAQGQVSDAARETIRTALAALPNDEAPGRLTRAPEAAGFSLLTGITPRKMPVARDSSRETPKAAVPKAAVGRDFSHAMAKAAKLRAERARRAHEMALAAAERDLQRSRKAAEQTKFKVRKLSADLQKAQAAEETLAGEVAIAQQKLESLRADKI
jgi:hypothetical protein